ncbi:MAG: hypothetical protein QOK43_548 [Acidimicrobiaceae bacterium]|nr:hypothetical protein [Acidimicrobiaceae bacterium]
MSARFEGRTAVVTGAASGIGFEMAAQLLAEGALVVAGDLDPAGVPEGTVPVEVDVSSSVAVERLVQTAVGQTGRIDLLFNNAGIGSTADPVSCTVEEWDAIFAVNVRGVFLGTKFALPHMLAAGRGAIVNTASVAGLAGLADRAAYCASKGAVISFTKAVAVQYAGTGVRCNCVCPGTVDSPWVGRLLDAAPDPDAARSALIARQPVGRLGRPEEVAKAALFLASDDADFVTGAAFAVDGGFLAR